MKANWLSIIPLSLALLVVSGCSDDSDQGALKRSQLMDLAQSEQSPIACALLVAKTIEDPAERAKAMASIAGTCAEAGRREQTLQLLSEAREVARIKPWPDLRLWCAIADKYAEAGQKEQASRILAENLIAEKTIHRIYDDIEQNGLWVIPDIAIQYAKIGEFDQALQTADGIKESARDRIRAWIGIAGGYLEIADVDTATRLLSQAIEVAKKIQKADQKSSAYADIAEMHGRLGQEDQASELLSLAMRTAMILEDVDSRSWELYVIGCAYARIGQNEQALHVLKNAKKIAGAIEEPSMKSLNLEFIAYELMDAGYLIEALETTQSIENPRSNSYILSDIACKIAKLSERDKDILLDITRTMKSLDQPTK